MLTISILISFKCSYCFCFSSLKALSSHILSLIVEYLTLSIDKLNYKDTCLIMKVERVIYMTVWCLFSINANKGCFKRDLIFVGIFEIQIKSPVQTWTLLILFGYLFGRCTRFICFRKSDNIKVHRISFISMLIKLDFNLIHLHFNLIHLREYNVTRELSKILSCFIGKFNWMMDGTNC